MDILKVKQLSVISDSGQPLLDKLSFTLRQGETLGVLGPNGAGKTTLLRCLYGALQHYQGCIEIEGSPLSRLSHRERARRIAAVTQEFPADFQLSVRAVIETGRTAHHHWLTGADRYGPAVINRCAKLMHVSRYLDRDISDLSGGEKKRVMIARALVQQTSILVLDEPCNHLDIAQQLNVMQQLSQLPLSCIVSLHDINLAARYCDRLLVLDGGKLISLGSAESVLTENLFAQVFSVHTQTYQNPWQQWSFCATALTPNRCTKEKLNEVTNTRLFRPGQSNR